MDFQPFPKALLGFETWKSSRIVADTERNPVVVDI